MIQKYPKSLADAIKEIKLLRSQVTSEQELNTGWRKRCSEAEIASYAAAKERDETRKNFADLKERLHASELEVSRQQGYLQRVREDDAVSDPLVEIEGPDGKRMVSKRHPTPIMNAYGATDYLDHMNGREKRKHWTSY